MRYRKLVLLIMLALASNSRPAQAQHPWVAAGGAIAGTLSGGYITLSWVVLRAQMGHYLHDPRQVVGWTAAPVLIGGVGGAALGMWEPARLGTGFVYGSAGALAGAGIGYITGSLVSNRPEGKWAGGAIGAGLGMAIGVTTGIFFPKTAYDPTYKKSSTVIPIYQVRF
jgi:hypothetical protein